MGCGDSAPADPPSQRAANAPSMATQVTHAPPVTSPSCCGGIGRVPVVGARVPMLILRPPLPVPPVSLTRRRARAVVLLVLASFLHAPAIPGCLVLLHPPTGLLRACASTSIPGAGCVVYSACPCLDAKRSHDRALLALSNHFQRMARTWIVPELIHQACPGSLPEAGSAGILIPVVRVTSRPTLGPHSFIIGERSPFSVARSAPLPSTSKAPL